MVIKYQEHRADIVPQDPIFVDRGTIATFPTRGGTSIFSGVPAGGWGGSTVQPGNPWFGLPAIDRRDETPISVGGGSVPVQGTVTRVVTMGEPAVGTQAAVPTRPPGGGKPAVNTVILRQKNGLFRVVRNGVVHPNLTIDEARAKSGQPINIGDYPIPAPRAPIKGGGVNVIPGPNLGDLTGGIPRQDINSTEGPPMDLGNLLGNLGGAYINARWGQPQTTVVSNPIPQVTPVDTFGVPFVDVIPEAPTDSCGGRMVYKKVCGQYKWVRQKNRRRKRLATRSDLKDLAALKGILGQGKAFEVWIATHS